VNDTPKTDSIGECKEREENTCNAVHTVHTVHSNSERRRPIEVRMRGAIHKTVGRYCGFAEITIGQFYEEAAILFMDLNPVNGSLFVVEKPEKRVNDNGFEERMGELICIDELEDFIERVDKIKNSGVEIHRSNVKTLLKILKNCNKISQRSQHLETLMSAAMSYFE